MTEAAATIEAKKHGLRQGQDGAWTLALVLHPNDVPNWLLTAPMGQRLAVVVAALEEEAPPPPEKPKERKRFEELPLSQQCAFRCADKAFQKWIKCRSEPDTAWHVRHVCRIESRSELDTDERAATIWRKMDLCFLSETGRVTEQR